MAFLTKLEEWFMLAIFQNNEPVSLIDIRKYLHDKTGKDWAFASIYISLDKLKKKGFIESYKGEPKHIRGGKALRYYSVTKRGIRILDEAWKMQESLWKDFISSLGWNIKTDE